MHEMSLCEGIVRIIEKQAEKEDFNRVVKVRVIVGSLSGASEEALRFCFPFAARGTRAEGAAIEFFSAPDATLRVAEIEVE